MGKGMSFVAGAALGAAAGVVLGVLYAPRSGSETRADRCSDGRALAASGHRSDSRAGYGASASADRGALSRFAHVLERRASGRQQRGRHHGCHGSFGRSHRRIVLFYLTIVSSRSGPTEMILTGTPVSRSMNSTYSLS